MNSANTSTPVRAAMLIFHLNQQYQQEGNLHHLHRPPDNGSHISSTPPRDLDPALWHGSESQRQATRHQCYGILFYARRGLWMSSVRGFCYSDNEHINNKAINKSVVKLIISWKYFVDAIITPSGPDVRQFCDTTLRDVRLFFCQQT